MPSGKSEAMQDGGLFSFWSKARRTVELAVGFHEFLPCFRFLGNYEPFQNLVYLRRNAVARSVDDCFDGIHLAHKPCRVSAAVEDVYGTTRV